MTTPFRLIMKNHKVERQSWAGWRFCFGQQPSEEVKVMIRKVASICHLSQVPWWVGRFPWQCQSSNNWGRACKVWSYVLVQNAWKYLSPPDLLPVKRALTNSSFCHRRYDRFRLPVIMEGLYDLDIIIAGRSWDSRKCWRRVQSVHTGRSLHLVHIL